MIIIKDNFLQKEDFQHILSVSSNLSKVNENELKINTPSLIHKNGSIINQGIFNKIFLKNFHEKYTPLALKMLEELYYQKLQTFEYSSLAIIQTGKNYRFPIHGDTIDKILSGVIYVSPEINAGTIFYDNKKGKNKVQTEWKVNRGVFFSRKENKSWHSYEGDKLSTRVALVYNLFTKDIKKICKIENLNYFKKTFIENINPHLNRYLKFTID